MKYILFTFDGHGYPFAHHLIQEGHEVMVAEVQSESELTGKKDEEDEFDKKRRLALFDGILKKTPATEVVLKMKSILDPQNYFVIFDLNSLYRYADQVKDLGFHGNFVTETDYYYEADRDKAKEF